MIKLLFATTNEAKVNDVRSMLSGLPIEIVSLKDFPPVEPSPETGNNALENATEKAKYYFSAFHTALFSCDSVLEIDNLPKELQPTADTRNVGGKILGDEELIRYYAGLAKKYEKLICRYRIAICYISETGKIIASDNPSLSTKKFYITEKQQNPYQKGVPLDSLSIEISNDAQNANNETKREEFRKFFTKHIL